jgi:hypothetical protein
MQRLSPARGRWFDPPGKFGRFLGLTMYTWTHGLYVRMS